MGARRLCGWYGIAALAVTAALAPASASASGTFAVSSCGESLDSRADAWLTTVRAGEAIDSVRTCVSAAGDDGDGIVDFSSALGIRPTLPRPAGNPTSATGAVGGISLTAPAGTSLTKLTYYRALESTSASWDVKMRADAKVLEDCVNGSNAAGTSAAGCGEGTYPTTTLPAGTKTLDLGAWCVSGPCAYSSGPGPYDFAAALYGSTVTVSDPVFPAVTAPVVTNTNGVWVTPASRIKIAGSDTLGLSDLQLTDGGSVVSHVSLPGCVDWSLTPCAEASAGGSTSVSKDLNAKNLLAKEGMRSIATLATDGAGNTTESRDITVGVDTTPPVAQDVTGGGLKRDQGRTIGWTLPAGGSPIVSARVQVCNLDADYDETGCTWSDAPTAGPFAVDLPSPTADVVAHVELTDAAGNIGTDDYGTELARDGIAPTVPTLKIFGGSGNVRSYVVAAKDYDALTVQPRLCQGSSCTTLDPVTLADSNSAIVTVTAPGPGDYRLEASAVDRAGNASDPATALFTITAPLAALGAGTGNAAGANGATGQLMKLTPIMPAKLSGSTLLVRGTLVAGSASLVTVTVAGRHTNGKAAHVVKKAKLAANGKFAVRLKLPSKLNRKSGVLVTIAATPNAGYAAAKVRKRVKG